MTSPSRLTMHSCSAQATNKRLHIMAPPGLIDGIRDHLVQTTGMELSNSAVIRVALQFYRDALRKGVHHDGWYVQEAIRSPG